MCLFEFLSEFAWAVFPNFPWYLSKNIQAMRFLLAGKKKKIMKSKFQSHICRFFLSLLIPAVLKYPDMVLKADWRRI